MAYLVGCRNGASAEAVGAAWHLEDGSVVGVLAASRTLWNAKNGTKNPEHAEGREDTHNTGREEGGGEQRGGKDSHCSQYIDHFNFMIDHILIMI